MIDSFVEDVRYEPEARIPGIKAQHAIITPSCIAMRGRAAAIDEALGRMRLELETAWKAGKTMPALTSTSQ